MIAAPFLARPGGLQRARMATGSMFPLVPEGTVMLFGPPKAVKPGDLVVFSGERGWFCHRVVAVHDGTVETWGDWSLIPDPPLPLAALEGRCVALVRKGTVVDLDWPLMRLVNRAVAALLPRLKRRLFPRG